MVLTDVVLRVAVADDIPTLVATMAGAPLYLAAGFTVDGAFDDESTGVAIPLLRMSKSIT